LNLRFKLAIPSWIAVSAKNILDFVVGLPFQDKMQLAKQLVQLLVLLLILVLALFTLLAILVLKSSNARGVPVRELVLQMTDHALVTQQKHVIVTGILVVDLVVMVLVVFGVEKMEVVAKIQQILLEETV